MLNAIRLSSSFREMVFTASIMLARVIAQLLLIGVCARSMVLGDYGQLLLFMAATEIASGITRCGLPSANLALLLRDDHYRQNLYANSILIASFMTMSLWVIIETVLLSAEYFSIQNWNVPDRSVVELVLINSLLVSLEQAALPLIRKLLPMTKYYLAMMARPVTVLGLSAVIFQATPSSIDSVAGLVAMSSFVICLLYSLMLVLSGLVKAPSLSVLRKQVNLGFPMIFGNLAQAMNYKAGLFLLANFGSEMLVANYGSISSLVQRLWLVPESVKMAAVVRTIRPQRSINEINTKYLGYIAGTAGFMVFAGAILYAIKDRVLELIFGGAVTDDQGLTEILLPGIVILGAGKIGAAVLSGRGQTVTCTVGACLGLVVTVLLGIVTIPVYGAVGAAVTSSLAYSTVGLFYISKGFHK